MPGWDDGKVSKPLELPFLEPRAQSCDVLAFPHSSLLGVCVLACDFDFSLIGRNCDLVAASSEVRQAYKQFIGAVVELLSGEAVSEELYQVAQTVYTLFGGDDTEYVGAKKVLSKR